MIPLRDTVPSKTFPVITISLILINTAVFFYELSLGSELPSFISRYGIIPVRFFHPLFLHTDVLAGVAEHLLTFMFLHGGWLHVIWNMLYLWIFGDNVEDRMGHFRYLIFYLGCGVASGCVQILINPSSHLPIVGASGAIAGVMGAYLLLYPFGRVATLFFFLFFVDIIEIPAFFFLGFWFVLQFFSGSFSLTSGSSVSGGVAWWAHIGGFLCGALLVVPFTRRRRMGWQAGKHRPW